jgi:hypothetical protein
MIDFSTVNDADFDAKLGGRLANNPSQLALEADEEILKIQYLPQSTRPYAELLIPFYGGE